MTRYTRTRNGDEPRDSHRRPQEQPHDPVDERLALEVLFLGGQVVGRSAGEVTAVPLSADCVALHAASRHTYR
jgi:hypothetical protein